MMRLFGFWTVLVALSISVVAAYYSIVGLVAIFAASMIPVIIMGSVLEIGKITSAIWLHIYFSRATFLIKSYLSIAVILLMFITSMGIFGFLSKAHIEQNAVALEGQAQLERIAVDISRSNDIVARAESKITKLDTQDETADTGLQEKIAVEEQRIATVYNRLRTDVNFTQSSLSETVAPYEEQAAQAQDLLDQLANYIAEDNIRALQGLVGATVDGRYGAITASKVETFRNNIEEQRSTALTAITETRKAAQLEITRLRSVADSSIAASNELINRLRSQVGTLTNVDVEDQIQEQRTIIANTSKAIDDLFESKYQIEAEARKLEAEVGPVKYIAQLIYGDETTRNNLENAVRWIIIMLVFVFDPLAIVLVIAGITLVENSFPKRKIEPIIEHDAPVLNHNDDNDDDISELKVDTDEEIVYNNEIVSNGLTQREIDEMVREQIELNTYTRKIEAKIKLDEVVNKMKEDGQWPDGIKDTGITMKDVVQADTTGELEELLNRADDETLKEVYSALTNQLKK